jgi:protein-disulfide isomerase
MQRLRKILAVLACVLLSGAAAAQDTETITSAGLKQMLAHPGTELLGARNPDVIIVEYFDYDCPYCKQLVPTLRALLADDPKIAVLYKEWPIFGGASVYAASSALAAGYQGKYLAAHDALMGGSRLARDEQVDATLRKAGVDMGLLEKDRVAHAGEIAALLARNDEEARALTLDGTPGLVVGRQLVPGIADVRYFKQLIANSRREK